MGKQGVKEAAERSYGGAHYLCEQLLSTGKFQLTYNQPFFNEFCVSYDGDVDALQRKFTDNGFFGGIKIDDNKILFAVTEARTKAEIDKLVELTKEA
jgi:glycine dehydrogenase subunit 1